MRTIVAVVIAIATIMGVTGVAYTSSEKDEAALDVLIGGPENVDENIPDCLYQSSVQGGTPPYSYVWKKDGNQIGTADTVLVNTGTSDFTLTLDVTDSGSDSGSDQLNVDVISGGGPCFDG